MEFKEYTDGKRIIKATVNAYEALYRQQGFKPFDKGRSNRRNKAESPTVSAGTSTDDGDMAVLDGEIGA